MMTWEEIIANSKQQPAPVWVAETNPFPPIKLTAQMHDDVLFGRTPCPYCNGKQFIEYREREEHSGETRERLVICRCDKLRHKRKVLEQLLPGKYIEANLWTLKPSPLSRVPSAAQAEEITYLKAHCDLSAFLCGAPGTSKTTYASALLRRAVERDWEHFYRPGFGALSYNKTRWIWRVNFDTLMAQYLRKQGDRDAPEPDVTPERIKARSDEGRKFVLCLEEVDKAKLTEHRCNKLFDIIDTLYNCKGQLIMTTNLRWEQFDSMFTSTGNDSIDVTGSAIIRRIREMCIRRDYFQGGEK